MLDDLPAALGLTVPILQAPMAGVSTPAMAAAVSEAGGLGALGLGGSGVAAAAEAIAATRALTRRAFNVNFFCHGPARADPERERAWIARAAPLFEEFGAQAPATLAEPYTSFRDNPAMLALILGARPAVASFHFGLPRPEQLAALRAAGVLTIASATSLAEAHAVERAGLDAVAAQGWSAGGHRGVFDPMAPDERLSTEALTRLLAREIRLPVIAAGGLMDGADVRAALGWGAAAAQLGTAFVACPESAADGAYRARLLAGGETAMTAAISGRPARCLTNRFTEWARHAPASAIPDYPRAYDLGKALNAAAKARGEPGFGAQWSGAGADRARTMPAGALVATLAAEMAAAG